MFQEADESLAGREGVLGVLVHELFSLRSTYLPEVYLRLGGGEAGRFRGGTGLVRQGIPPRSQAGDHSAA